MELCTNRETLIELLELREQLPSQLLVAGDCIRSLLRLRRRELLAAWRDSSVSARFHLPVRVRHRYSISIFSNDYCTFDGVVQTVRSPKRPDGAHLRVARPGKPPAIGRLLLISASSTAIRSLLPRTRAHRLVALACRLTALPLALQLSLQTLHFLGRCSTMRRSLNCR